MPKLLNLPTFDDKRGSLTVLDHLPFFPKRLYWIYNNRDSLARGGHRHHRCRQVLVAVHGECRIFSDDSITQENFVLNKPELALLVEPQDWHIMYAFSQDCVLLVIASESYDLSDYIDEPYRAVPDFNS